MGAGGILTLLLLEEDRLMQDSRTIIKDTGETVEEIVMQDVGEMQMQIHH